MQAIDICNIPIDQLRADFMSIMLDNILQYGDNLESNHDGRTEEKDTLPVSRMSSSSRVGIDDHR